MRTSYVRQSIPLRDSLLADRMALVKRIWTGHSCSPTAWKESSCPSECLARGTACPLTQSLCIWLIASQSHLDAILLCAIPTKRRSAGLPYLILGSLSGAQTGSRDLSICFDRLFAAVAPSSTLPAATQSHAINILRVLFLDGKLGSAVKPFVERAFVVAVEGFGATECVCVLCAGRR